MNSILKTFKIGGVHPDENKITALKSIEILSVPKTAYIPLSQALGAPSVPIVQKGDKVKVGQLLAKGEAFISANVHSSVSGTVNKIDDVMDSSGYRRKTIIIDVEGDEWMETIDRNPSVNKVIKKERKEIIEIMKEAGIVGLGGATFPSHVKMMVPEGKTVTYLIINAAECEPYLTSDHRVMIEKPEEVIIGVGILMRALNVEKAIIGIENNKKDCIEKLSQVVKDFPGITIQGLKTKYPQGGEKQLIKALINREVPSGKLPIEVGCVVQNVGTALAVYEAVQKNKPLFERVVTITGKSLSNPTNLLIRIGTPIADAVAKAGGLPSDTGKVINGGPMMGKAIPSLEAPIVKGSSGIVILTEKESKRLTVANCIRCGKCVEACPMGLEPYYLAVVAENQEFEDAENNNIMDCMECGSCSFTCPSGRPLVDYVRVGKTKVGQIIRNRAK